MPWEIHMDEGKGSPGGSRGHPRPSRVTLCDIAAATGYAVNTVSVIIPDISDHQFAILVRDMEVR